MISDRPNLVPAGIGNNTSGYDTSILMFSGGAQITDGDDAEVGVDEVGSGSDDDREKEVDVDVDELLPSETEPVEEEAGHSGKRKGDVLESAASKRLATRVKKTGARSGSSAPASSNLATTSRKGVKGVLEKFSDAAARDDETARRMLELKGKRSEASASIAIAKLNARADYKKTKELARAKLIEKKLDQEHQLRLTQLQLQAQMSMQGGGGHTQFGAGMSLSGVGPGGSSGSSSWGGLNLFTPIPSQMSFGLDSAFGSGSSSPFGGDMPLTSEPDAFGFDSAGA